MFSKILRKVNSVLEVRGVELSLDLAKCGEKLNPDITGCASLVLVLQCVVLSQSWFNEIVLPC